MAKAGTGKVVQVNKGDVYVFDGHEAHYLTGGPQGAEIVCIFTPPCTGQEVRLFHKERAKRVERLIYLLMSTSNSGKMQSKYSRNAAKIQSKCSQNAAKMRPKCSQNIVKMQPKCGQNAAKMQPK